MCTALPGKHRSPTEPPAGRECIFINAAINSVSLWNDGVNKFNCNSFTVIDVIMLELKNNKHNTYYHCTYLYIVNAVMFKLLLTSYLKRDLAKKKQQKKTITLPL